MNNFKEYQIIVHLIRIPKKKKVSFTFHSWTLLFYKSPPLTSTTIPTGGCKFGLINSSVACSRGMALKWKLSTLLTRRINFPTKNKIHTYFLAEEKNDVQTTQTYWFEPIEVKAEYLLSLTLLNAPKFHLVPLAASTAEFYNCTLQFVLIGGKCRPDVKDNYNCLMKITCFWHQYMLHPVYHILLA